MGWFSKDVDKNKKRPKEVTEVEESEEDSEAEAEEESEFDSDANTEAEEKAIDALIAVIKKESFELGTLLELYWNQLGEDGWDEDNVKWFIEVGARVIKQ